MGTYMQTGLVHEFSVPISRKPKHISLDGFKTGVASAMVTSPESYNSKEVDGMCFWELLRDARESHLVDLLSRYYSDFYGPNSSYFANCCRPIIDYLSTKPSDRKLAET